MRVRALIHPLQARTRNHKHAPQVIGIAHPDVLREMKREFLEKPDSKDTFTAWNSGPNETTCEKVLCVRRMCVRRMCVCARTHTHTRTRTRTNTHRSGIS